MTRFNRICALGALLLLAAAGFAQQAPDYTTFQPKFQDDVFMLNPYVTNLNTNIQAKTPVNPAYALSETSALELSVVLKEYGVTVFHSGPFGWLSSWGFAPTRAVPWLQFPDGTICNAGLIAWYWSHGYPPGLVWMWVKQDIDYMQKAQALNPDLNSGVARMP